MRLLKYGVPSVAVLLILGVVIKNAWIGDDAYITFRTVDNFLNGLGLRWNPWERVQTYTHPLWMFAITSIVALSGEFFYSTMALSICLTAGTLGVLFFSNRPSPFGMLTATIALISSRAFIDYSTSGLENPLAHCLAALFISLHLLPSKTNGRNAFLLTLIAALAAVNRLDHFLIYLPMVIYHYVGLSRKQAAISATAGLLPLVLWELFSLFYYGFPFPNTAYAKLNTGIDGVSLLLQGTAYVQYAFMHDPVTPVTILLGMTVAAMTRSWRRITVAIGIALYCAYILKIGGDFMAGRFFSVPFVAAVSLILTADESTAPRWRLIFIRSAPALMVLAALMSGAHPVVTGDAYRATRIWHGISDERGFYFRNAGLVNVWGKAPPFARTRFYRRAFQEQKKGRQRQKENRRHVVLSPNVGIFGFKAGPLVHIFDSYALVDPLFSRLPSYKDPHWRIGHFRRLAPRGYRETLKGGKNVIEDKKLAAYYDKLRLIIEGDLLDGNRLLTILKMNLGQYNHLIDREFYRNLNPESYRKK